MTKAKARSLIKDKLRGIKALLDEAKRIADENGLEVRLNIDGDHAGTYYGKSMDSDEMMADGGEWWAAWSNSWC